MTQTALHSFRESGFKSSHFHSFLVYVNMYAHNIMVIFGYCENAIVVKIALVDVYYVDMVVFGYCVNTIVV